MLISNILDLFHNFYLQSYKNKPIFASTNESIVIAL